MTEYFISIDGRTYGPASLGELEQWCRAGSFGPGDFVWNGTAGAWIPAAAYSPVASIFVRPPIPSIGLEEIGELSGAEEASVVEQAVVVIDRCANHPERDAGLGCPVCRKRFCTACTTVLDGLRVCLDCAARERAADAPPWKRYALVAALPFAVILFGSAAFVYVADDPPDQPDTPRRIAIPLADEPVRSIAEEDLPDAAIEIRFVESDGATGSTP